MPKGKANMYAGGGLIKSLRSAHDPHFKLEGRVGGIEKELGIKVAKLHKSLSKSFAIQRKTLVRVLGLEGRVSELELQQAAEDQAKQGIDEILDGIREDEAEAEEEIGGGTKTKTKPKAKKKPKIRLKRKKIKAKDIGFNSRVFGKDESGQYLGKKERIQRFKGISSLKDDLQKGDGGGGNALADILVSVTSIRDILINQIKQKRDDAKKKRRATQNANRKEKESGLEILKKGFGAVKSGAEKVVAPVKNLFKEVLEFIGKIVFGRIIFKLMEWFSDKKNQKKVAAIGKFLSKTWPVLLAAYLLFGNAFGRMAVKLGVMITKFSIRLVTKIIPALVKAVAKMKLGKWIKRIPGLSAGGLLPQMSEGGMIEGPQSGYPVSLDGGKSTAFEGHGTEEIRRKGNDSFVIPIDTPDTKKNPFLTEQRTDEANKLGFTPSGQGGEGETKKPMTQEELVEAALPSLMQFMEQNNAAIDSDPDAIYGEHMRMELDRDGKMINFGKTIANMSEWAFNTGVEHLQNNESIEPEVKEALLKKMAWVRKETLENPNFKSDLAFDVNKDIPGTAANRLFLKAQGDTSSPAAMAGISARDRALLMNRRGMSRGGLLKGYKGGGFVSPMQQMGNLREERKEIYRRQVNGKMSKADRKKLGEINAQIAELGKKIQASQKSTSTPKEKIVPKTKKEGSGWFGGLFGGGKKGGGGSSGILGPISSDVGDMVSSTKIDKSINKPNVKSITPPVKKSTVQTYNEEKEKVKVIASGGGNSTAPKSGAKNDLPNFDAAAKRSKAKIKVLGISV